MLRCAFILTLLCRCTVRWSKQNERLVCAFYNNGETLYGLVQSRRADGPSEVAPGTADIVAMMRAADDGN